MLSRRLLQVQRGLVENEVGTVHVHHKPGMKTIVQNDRVESNDQGLEFMGFVSALNGVDC